MGTCYKCGKQITLKDEEVTCDNCNKVINYCCHNCKTWFSIYDESTKEKVNECKSCGFFECPTCLSCGTDCPKDKWRNEIIRIFFPEKEKLDLTDYQKVHKMIDYIEDTKFGKEQRTCTHGVPISYAKGRIKRCVGLMTGHGTKSDGDRQKFIDRFKNVTDVKIGTLLTINQSREEGSYGQEYRDAFNYCICLGQLKVIKIRKEIANKTVEYTAYKRIEGIPCEMLRLKNLIQKHCVKCKTNYPLSELYCSNPNCDYKKGKKKGDKRELNQKISNVDTCQLNRCDFKKDGGNRPSEKDYRFD